MHLAHRRRSPRQAIGPTLIALLALLVSGAVDLGQPSAAAGTSRTTGIPAASRELVAAARFEPGWEAMPATEPRARAKAPIIVETWRGDTQPTRPAVDVPEAPVITTKRLARASSVAILGDSYTSGWNGAGMGAKGWPAIVARARGWTTLNLAVPGTGFLNPGWTGQTIGSRVATAVRARPDIVFIVGGHNDSRWSVAATNAAADAVIDRVHAALPDAALVIVAPIWQDGSPPVRCLALRDHLRRKAAAVGARFIDPLHEGWFAGRSHRFIGADGLHPTDAGHRFMADRILADLAGA